MKEEKVVSVENEEGEVVEVPEEMLEALMGTDIEAFLSDLLLFDYLAKNNGVVTITEEDMKTVEEMRMTRAVEFSSETVDEKKVLMARFIFRGEEADEEVDNDI